MTATTPNPTPQVQPRNDRWTVEDVNGLPDTSDRYELIDGDLHVTRAPHWKHQSVSGKVYAKLLEWSIQTGLGEPVMTPGVIFSPTDVVIPDVVWASKVCIETRIDEAGHFTGAPELVIEVLSKSPQDRDRDRKTKLKLYSTEGVQEYWILDREHPKVEVFRRDHGILAKAATLYASDALTSPLLPEFSCAIAPLFS